MKQTQKTLALWLMIILFGMVILHFVQQKPTSIRQVSFSEFLEAVNADAVDQVTIQNDTYSGTFKKNYQEGVTFQTMGPPSSEKVLTTLADHKVKIEFKPAEDPSFWQHLLISWLPLLLLFGLFFFSMRQMQMGGGKAMSFGRSRARLLVQSDKKVTFNDVAGIEEAKDELEEIISFLKEPKKFTRLGGRIPKGVLLMGSPGTGKTLLARAIAGEANVPFFSISGSDFVEMFVGVGAARVRDLFEQGKRNAPCIIFIDEIDAVGRHRGAGLGGGHDEREQTLNQLLVEMDGFESNEGVIIVAATNRPDVLDPALLRPGRFDRRIVVPRPDVRGREEILRIHARKLAVGPNVDFRVMARGTPGFSGADLANVINEAALLAARNNKTQVEMIDMELAKDKVLMGSERRSMIITADEKKNTAYHEAGHVLVAKLIPDTDPIHKVSIIPRGQALGVTQQLPTDDRFTQNRSYCENSIAVLMGGRCAEELIFNQPTTGAGNDIERATELARKMVCEWGMSDKMGPLAFGKREEMVFLGKDMGQHKDYSETTANMIDEEVKRLVFGNYERAKKLLAGHLEQLHAIALGLLEREALDNNEIEVLMKGGKLPPLAPVIIPKSETATTAEVTPTTATPVTGRA